MALIKHELDVLAQFIPIEALEDVKYYLHTHKIHLIIRKERKSVLGDYRPAHQGKPHTVSVNASLNKYHFLITLLHEFAHLLTYINYQNKVAPHGSEWKHSFAQLLHGFIQKNIFPEKIALALNKSMGQIAASTCSDPHLYKILLTYNVDKGMILVEQLSIGDEFRTEKGLKFKVILKRRTRFECEEIKSGKKYLFPGIFEVFKE